MSRIRAMSDTIATTISTNRIAASIFSSQARSCSRSGDSGDVGVGVGVMTR
jgi:hypothetical protein